MIKIRRSEKGMIEFMPSVIPKISLCFEIQTSDKIIDSRAYLKLKVDDNEFKEIGCLQLDLPWMAGADFPDVPSTIRLCTYISEDVVLELDRLANKGKIELSLDAFFLSHDHKWIRACGENAIPYLFHIYAAEWKEVAVNLVGGKKACRKK